MDWFTKPAGKIGGKLSLPGDKSISHRALMFNALADGTATIRGLLEGEDCLATVRALRAMGVTITRHDDGVYEVQGVGLNGLQAPADTLDFGNSGTAMRLMAGVLCAQNFASKLSGDSSLSRRPMARVIRPLKAMGAEIGGRGNRPPLKIEPVGHLHPIRYGMPVASAQVKSAILLASLYTDGLTEVSQPAPTRDHSERLLRAMGVDIEFDTELVRMISPASLQSVDIDVPADISSAAFFMVAASLAEDGVTQMPGVGVNPTRTGVIDILREMGARIELENQRTIGGEPVADLTVYPSSLHGVSVKPEQVALAIDEFPVLFVAAACAKGVSEFQGIEELRHKECDRIAAMVAGLTTLGVQCADTADSATIVGGALGSGSVSSFDDHRIAMAFAVAGSRASGPLEITGVDNVNTSFPQFTDCCTSLGMTVGEQVS